MTMKAGTELPMVAVAFGATGTEATPVDGTHGIPVALVAGDAAASGLALAANQLTGTGTGRSGTITLGGTAQQLAAANASRKLLRGQNISTGDLWINENSGTAAANGTDAYLVSAGATFSVDTNEAVSIVGATTGQAFTATEV